MIRRQRIKNIHKKYPLLSYHPLDCFYPLEKIILLNHSSKTHKYLPGSDISD